MARRFDRADFPKAVVTAQGFLRASAYACRTGVLSYRKPDGSILRELRSPEEVFKADSMATLGGVPLVNQHPKANSGLLNPDNVKSLMVGFTSENVERAEDKYLQVTVTVTDAETIAAVKAGQRELSCGYTCDLVPTPGVFNGEYYDVVQKNIVYNHLASVPNGRAGADVSIHLDAEDGELIETQKEEKPKMAKLKIGESEFDASDELVKAHKDASEKDQKKMDEMKAKCDAFEKKAKDDEEKDKEKSKKMDALEARCDSSEGEVKKLKASHMDASDITARVNARVALLETAKKFVAKEVKLDAMSDEDIMKEVIKADSKDTDLTGKSLDYVKARFDIVSEKSAKATEARAALGTTVLSVRTDAMPDAAASRQKMIDEQKKASSEPIGVHVKK